MLANQLGRRGIRAVIIDRHSGPAQQSRAMAVHARSLEIFSKLGVADEALARGQRAGGMNMWPDGKWGARVPLGDIGADLSPFPYILMLGQDENEYILGAKLADWGIAVEWNTELTGFEQHADHVACTIRRPDGSSFTLKAKYVAGCDGARSAIREMSGIKFPGAPYDHVFFVADTEATGAMVPAEVNVYLWKDGFHLFFPMPGENRWRLVGILPKELRGRQGLGFEDVIPSLTKEAGPSLSFQKCDWFSTYRIHHRCVERFRDRRCFLLGDAAHVHSPAGGQGMNTGLQDAYNLAWKLALVVQGRADERLLETYEAERLPVAQALLKTTDRMFTFIVSESRLAALFRTRILVKLARFAMTRERARRRVFRLLSQVGIHYPDSMLSKSAAHLPKGAPRAGDRFPWLRLRFAQNGPIEDVFQKLDDTRFNLIVVGQDASEEGIATLRVADDPVNAQVLAGAGIPRQAFYLVRPDGYIGLAGTRLEPGAIARYFSSIGVDPGATQEDERTVSLAAAA
jgi:2-polyprenyl-6-methoxyphenol hydroxylase-like FAD-dependent oxidoreductase